MDDHRLRRKRLGPLHLYVAVEWYWDRTAFWRMAPHRHLPDGPGSRLSSTRKCARCKRTFDLKLPDPWLGKR